MKGLKGKLKEKIALLRLKKGDTEAFGFLYDQYVESIYRYIRFRVQNQDIAEDLTHEVFLKTWEYIIEGKDISSLRSFLYRLAYRQVADHYRSRSRQTVLLDEVESAELAVKPEQEDHIDMRLLKEQIVALKTEYQDLIVLRHIEGLSIDEIAAVMSKDANNIRVTLHRAIKALREHYKD